MHRCIKALDTVTTFLQHQNLLVPEKYSMESYYIVLKWERKANYVTAEDEQTMWNNGVLRSRTPQSLD